MSQAAIKWGQLQRFLKSRGFEIRGAGGEKMIVAPKTHPLPPPPEGRNTVLIGHTSCSRAGDQVKSCYLKKICTHFGVTIAEIAKA